MSAPAPSIAASILMPQDRIARRPLEPWAASLAERLRAARRDLRRNREFAGEMGAIGNNAGLIAASRGEMEMAWRVTEWQLWWHGRHARRSGEASVAANGVQPWVNLGRLESLSGRLDEALARFAGLTRFAVADRLDLGCVRLDGAAWTALVHSREQFLRFLNTVFISDSLRAMLLNRRFELVHPFVAGLERTEGAMRWICEEARVVAECRLGDPGAAAARADAAAREVRGWPRAVFRLREAEARTVAGETDAAGELLSQLAALLTQLSPERKADPVLMAVTARIPVACHEAGRREDAFAAGREVLEGARAAGDELIEIEMLQVLAATAPEAEAAAWVEEARDLARTTEYARYRRAESPPCGTVIPELYERLREAYLN